MKKALCMLALAFVALPVSAAIVSVSGPLSSFGAAPVIIPPPPDALDDIVTNRGQQGFNEAQGVITSVAHTHDGGGVIPGGAIPVGTRVDSHMIFLNSAGAAALAHREVVWEFNGRIIGIMSDSGGTHEAASTFELGAPGTNYTIPFVGSGPAAPYPARGLEGGDALTLISPNKLKVTMTVTEPGDWIRVVTVVPAPGAILLAGIGTSLVGWLRRRRTI